MLVYLEVYPTAFNGAYSHENAYQILALERNPKMVCQWLGRAASVVCWAGVLSGPFSLRAILGIYVCADQGQLVCVCVWGGWNEDELGQGEGGRASDQLV